MHKVTAVLLCTLAVPLLAQQTAAPVNPYLLLMEQARAHARAHGAPANAVPPSPVLSPNDASVLDGSVPIDALHTAGFHVVPWTTNDPVKMRALIGLDVDGIISDRPDLLQQAVAEARRSTTLPAEQRVRLASFDVSAHRGGRGLRPENTLPSFESGLDNLISSIETDTGVTTDGKSLIWHDQFLNPESCRRADGKPYALGDRVYIRDISMVDAQRTFICDKLHSRAFPDQRNDLAFSPVASAFARQEGLLSPYVPTHAAQLFEFVRFYADYYRTGPGRTHAHATERALAAEKVRFNLETKILPEHLPSEMIDRLPPGAPADLLQNHTVSPQVFVDTLTHAIAGQHMEARSEIQSFDFRTLLLIQEQHSRIPTYYLVENSKLFSTDFVPEPLRQPNR